MDFGDYPSMKTAFIRIGRYGITITLWTLGVAVLLYGLFFTSVGNRVLKPFIEKKLSTALETPITIDAFILTHDTLSLQFHDVAGNSVKIQGKYSLITLTLHALYQADLSHNKSTLDLKTTGIINGEYQHMFMQGSADIFKGNIQYRMQLSRFRPSDLHVSLNRIDYQSLMTWLEYPHHSSTTLTGDIDLHGLNRRDVQGTVTLSTRTQNFIPSQIIDDNTSFDFFSLFTDEQGMIQPFHLNLILKTSVEELGILEQFAMLPLRGKANLTAAFQGDQDRLVLDASTNLAKSSTQARVHWKRLRPSYVYLDVQHADANALFHLFSKKSLTEGSISLRVESISNAIHYRGSFTSKATHLNFDDTTTHDQMLHDLLKAIP